MTSTGGWGVPGSGALVETIEREIIWGGDRAKGMVLEMSGNYSSAILDAGNTITTDIRAGLIVAKLTTGGELVEWDPEGGLTAPAFGEEAIFGVNPIDFRTLDFNAAAQDRVLPVIVRAPFKAASLLIGGSALVGHASEFIAREALVGGGSILDDDPQGFLGGASWRRQIQNGDRTLTSADNYTSYFCHSADADFILPAVQNGLKFRFFMSENFELQISSATSVFVTGNDVTGDGVTYTTTAEQIGAYLEIEGVNIDIAGTNTPSWVCHILKTPFSTDDFLAHTIDT